MWLDIINIIAILLQNLLWISANYLQANANKQFLINFSNFISILLEWLIFDLNHMNQFLRMFYVNINCWHNKTVLTVKFECSLLCGAHTQQNSIGLHRIAVRYIDLLELYIDYVYI